MPDPTNGAQNLLLSYAQTNTAASTPATTTTKSGGSSFLDGLFGNGNAGGTFTGLANIVSAFKQQPYNTSYGINPNTGQPYTGNDVVVRTGPSTTTIVMVVLGLLALVAFFIFKSKK